MDFKCLILLSLALLIKQDEIQNTKCNDLFLTSYMLSGQQIATNEPVVFCPSIKNNCCTKLDQKHLFNTNNNIVPS